MSRRVNNALAALGLLALSVPASAQSPAPDPLVTKLVDDMRALDGLMAAGYNAKQHVAEDMQAILDREKQVRAALDWYERDDAGLRKLLPPAKKK